MESYLFCKWELGRPVFSRGDGLEGLWTVVDTSNLSRIKTAGLFSKLLALVRCHFGGFEYTPYLGNYADSSRN